MAPFKVDQGDTPEGGVAPPRLIPALDVGEQCKTRLGLALEASAVDQFALEAREEAPGHRIVVSVADAAHRGAHAQLCPALPEGKARILRTLIAVVNDITRPALRNRHVERREREFRTHLLADGPAHDAAALHDQHNRQEEEAGPGIDRVFDLNPHHGARNATAPQRGDGENQPVPELEKRIGKIDYGPPFYELLGSRQHVFAKAPKWRKVMKQSVLKLN